VQALSHCEVREILRNFETLNPYGIDVVNDDETLGRSPWKVEHDSLNQELWCYAIATKRYALYRATDRGPRLLAAGDSNEIVNEEGITSPGEQAGDWSEHGLGLYMDPTDDQRRIGEQRRRAWMQHAWQWILDTALSHAVSPLPDWAERYALTQFTVSTPNHTGWFQAPNTGGYVAGKPRPFAFGLLGHVDPFATHWVDPHPAAPYDREPARWGQLPWYDRRTSEQLRTMSADRLGDDPQALVNALTSGAAVLRTVANVIRLHGERPERKSRGPDGEPTSRQTVGLLRRRPVHSAQLLTTLIGKEGNQLLERATSEVSDPADYRTTYARADTGLWRGLTLPVLHDIHDELGTAYIAERVGVSARQVRNWLNGADEPHSGACGNRQRAEQVAADWASEQIHAAGKAVPSHPAAVLYAYLMRFNEIT